MKTTVRVVLAATTATFVVGSLAVTAGAAADPGVTHTAAARQRSLSCDADVGTPFVALGLPAIDTVSGSDRHLENLAAEIGRSRLQRVAGSDRHLENLAAEIAAEQVVIGAGSDRHLENLADQLSPC